MPIIYKENSIGAWAFLIGTILAIFIGLIVGFKIKVPEFATYTNLIYGILILLGIIIGFVNVTGKESKTFLLAGAILVVVSKFGMDSISQGALGTIQLNVILISIFQALLTLFIPATVIVALKTVFSIAST